MIEAPKTEGVYFLWNDSAEVIYVGTAQNLHQRILQSHAERGGAEYSYIENSENRLELEKMYIRLCCPKLNGTYKEQGRKPKYPDIERYKFNDDKKGGYAKIVLRMNRNIQAALQQEARKIAAEENRNYSLTELINDILVDYVKKEAEH